MEHNSSHTHSQEQEEKKFIVDSAEFIENGAPIPETYNQDYLYILPRDPLWFFSYWEVTPGKIEAVRNEHGADIWGRSEVVLRIYDVTSILFDGRNAHAYFDVGVIMDSRQWYVRVNQPGRHYLVDLGLRFPDGRFITLLRSNRIQLPFGRVSDLTDGQWMAVNAGAVNQEEWEKVMHVADVSDHIGRSSGEVSKSAAAKSLVQVQRWEFLKSVYSSASSRLSSPGIWHSPQEPTTAEKEKR